jgi:ATP-binding cassette subfamily B protein
VIEDGEEEPASFGHSLVLEGVTFAYKPGEPVLRDVHLEIRKGEKIALVGGSGAGKSTLTDLLLRLYDPQEGRILYDGTDIRRFRQRAYRRQFGVVNQDCLLFSGTIEDNIVYGRELDAGAYARAREVANCDFIDDFPDGDQTRVGDRGITLSGGQRQRIALARAVYSRPDFLILDEATSALDAESERQVQEGIRRAVENATAILVAHRLSTVREADRIVVMEQGQIQDIGRHEELLARNDTYRHLCSLQFLPEVSAHA